MNSALFIGAIGMKTLSQGMQVVSNNLANASTLGYKQQGILFSDMISTSQAGMGGWWNAQEDSRVALGQTGKGVQVDSVRTIFKQGGMESSNTVTDMALNGKGFFQVTDGVDLYYTRAGNFRPDNEGVLRTPSGLALNGYKYNEDGSLGGLQQVKIDKFAKMPAKATSQVDLRFNLGLDGDKSADAPIRISACSARMTPRPNRLFPPGLTATRRTLRCTQPTAARARPASISTRPRMQAQALWWNS